MSDNKDFTERFFSWAKSEGLESKDIAKELGKSQVVVSNWRSKGVPPNHYYACNAFVSKRAILKALTGDGGE